MPRWARTPWPPEVRHSRTARRPGRARMRGPTSARVTLCSPTLRTAHPQLTPVARWTMLVESSPLVGRFVSGYSTQCLTSELPRRGGFVPAHDVARELPTPEAVLVAVAPVPRVQQEVHRCGAEGAGHCAGARLRTSLMVATPSRDSSVPPLLGRCFRNAFTSRLLPTLPSTTPRNRPFAFFPSRTTT